jgi:kumamolisin
MRAGDSSGGLRDFEPLAGSSKPPIPGATEIGPWPAGEEIGVSVLLRRDPSLKGFPSLEDLGVVPLGRRRYLGRPEFAASYAARLDDIEAVRGHAEASGLQVRTVDRVRRTVGLTGRVDAMGRSFGVELRRFEHPSAVYRGHRGPVHLPFELRDVVTGVFGLDARPQLRPHFRRNADPRATGYAATAVAAAYGYPSQLTGAGECIGILEFGGGFSAADLQSYFSGIGLAPPSPFVVGVDGVGNAPTGDPAGPDAEVELDIEIAGALADGARLAVYFAPNTEQGFVDALTTAIHDAENRPSVLSISWGGPEESWSAQARSAFESACQDGALQGVTILAAAGDQGASDGAAGGVLEVDFPASSPYVVGCGGTRLALAGTSIQAETVWNDLSAGEGATGGGVSAAFARPGYQSAASVPGAPNGFPGRGVPDVAGNADPETGYTVFVDGARAVIGGTSAVAPLWAALLARLGQGLGKPLGYANPLLYAPNVSATFRDITSGNNGGYSAGPGWDPCTGLGSPQAGRLMLALGA